jgi:hypothetical protein
MAAEKVTIEIYLGNAAMQTPQDVAQKLDQLADLFSGFGGLLFADARPILDRNGNTVGRWEVQ